MPWGAAIAAGGAIVGSMIASDGAEDAANTQANSTREGIAEQRRQFDLQRADSAPYRETGARSLKRLEDANTLDGSDLVREVEGDKGYQFGLQQGQRALSQRIAAGGGRVSGAALKAATRFGTDYASTGFGAAYQRRNDRLNRLAALAGIGQTSTAASAAAGTQSANAISGLLSSQGDAAAAGQATRAGIWGNTANQLAALGQRAFGQSGAGSRNSFRYDDPYRNPGYFGGGEGE